MYYKLFTAVPQGRYFGSHYLPALQVMRMCNSHQRLNRGQMSHSGAKTECSRHSVRGDAAVTI